MSTPPLTRNIDDLNRELENILEVMMNTPVLDKQWDDLSKKYLSISFKICMITGEISTCDSIIY